MDPWHVLTENKRNDHLFKIRNVTSSIINKCRTLFNCGREVSVDEAMIPFRGRLAIRVKMSDKPVELGVKLLVMRKAGITRMLSFMLAKMIEQLVISAKPRYCRRSMDSTKEENIKANISFQLNQATCPLDLN